jgi:hypothetical protein
MDWIAQFKPIITQIEQTSYQRGWDAAVQHIMEAAKRPVLTDLPDPPSIPFPRPTNRLIEATQPLITLVRVFVRTYPGNRGSHIVKAMREVFPQSDRKSIERTTRTALGRLKKRGLIENRGGSWYPAEGK